MTIWDKTKAILNTPLWGSTKAAPDGRLPLPRSGWGGGFGFGGLFGPAFQNGIVDYKKEAGDISENSAVAACLQWLCTSWPSQIPEVVTVNGDQLDVMPAHPFLDLLQEPNDQYEGVWLHQALLSDFWTHGNAYCHLVMMGDIPIELEYLPAYCTKPRPGDDGRLDHFEYKPDGKPIALKPETVLHFRFGINPRKLLEGRPPLVSASREIVADNNLSEWGAALSKNSGVPSGLISPAKSGPDGNYQPISPEDAKSFKANWREKTTGANRGDVLVMPAPLEYSKIAFSPKEMTVSDLRKTPEERICALFQIPPGVVQLGAGLDRNTYSNYAEAKKAAWEDNLVPVGDYFASVWTKAARMYPDSARVQVRYNRKNVRVLHEDESDLHEEAIDQRAARLITLTEARSVLGYETDEKTLAELAAETPAALPAPAGGGGSGKSWRGAKRGNRGDRWIH